MPTEITRLGRETNLESLAIGIVINLKSESEYSVETEHAVTRPSVLYEKNDGRLHFIRQHPELGTGGVFSIPVEQRLSCLINPEGVLCHYDSSSKIYWEGEPGYEERVKCLQERGLWQTD